MRHEGVLPEEDDARRFVGLLRHGGNEATKLDELRGLAGRLLVDANVLLSLACTYISEDDAIQFLNRFLHARSQASRAATADSRAAEVRREIDGLRRREGDLPNSVLATRLNALGIPAPRGGAWSGAQVYRVLKRTGGARRPENDTPATKRARPPSAP